MFLLITTPRFVLGYDTSVGRVDVFASGDRYYGLTWSPDGTAIALAHRGYAGAMQDLADYAMADRGYLVVGERRTWPFLNSPHQALWVDDKYIVATNTGRNAIARIAVDDLSVYQVRYDAAIWDQYDRSGAAGSHYNSVFFDGTHIYFVAHNFSQASFVVKAEWPSLELIERIPVPAASGIHNLWIDDAGRWITCDSNLGALINAKTGDVLWNNGNEGYTRGLAVTDELLVVGNSEISQREDRDFTASGVWLVDRATFALRDYIYLGHYGAVNEVRVCDVPDAAHHGRPLANAALAELRSSQQTIRATKLERARTPSADPAAWRYRAGKFLVDSGLHVAKDGEFALMTSRELGVHADCEVAARVHVRRWDEASHADLVLRYAGPEDQSMYAAIVQPQGPGAIGVSLWVEDGGWACMGTASIAPKILARFDPELEGLPIAFVARAQLLTVKVDEEIVLQISDARLIAGVAGMRMLGSALAISDFRVNAANRSVVSK